MTSETRTFIFDKAPFSSCHASTIVEVEPGRLLAAWFGGQAEGAVDVKIWLARHDGKQWSEPEVVAQEPGFPCWNPVLFLSQAKTLFLFYKAGPNPTSWSGYLRRSADGGKSWSTVEQMPAGLLGPIKNKPILLSNGSILTGTSVESHKAWACWGERSLDDGKSWKRFGPIAVPDHPFGIIQPTLFAASDKKVVALCRSRGLGFICQADSGDRGETWSPATPTELPNPNSGIDLVRTTKGEVYLVYNHSKDERTPLNLAHSKDQGKSWTMAATLEQGPGEFSYPAIIETQNGLLHVTYTWKRRHIKHVILDPAGLR